MSAPPVLPLNRARVFIDGLFAQPVRLAHPEGVAVAADGAVWCGTETGHLMRVELDGSAMASYGCTSAQISLDGPVDAAGDGARRRSESSFERRAEMGRIRKSAGHGDVGDGAIPHITAIEH